MSVIKSNENTPLDERPDDGGLQASTASVHHTGPHAGHHATGHSMKWMMLLCVLGMVVGVVGWAGWGVNIGGLFCLLMMMAMVWMMVARAGDKVRHRDHESQFGTRR